VKFRCCELWDSCFKNVSETYLEEFQNRDLKKTHNGRAGNGRAGEPIKTF
jgi:hypothetical protein